MNEDDILSKFGVIPRTEDLPEIRRLLAAEIERESRSGAGETDSMRLHCIQLFANGTLEDTLSIWQAKKSGWDASMSIEVQLLCGRGLNDTKNHLASHPSQLAKAALDYILESEKCGDFVEFMPADWLAEYVAYYSDAT